jgi:hypothetical protein
MERALFAQAADHFGWSGWWIFLILSLGVLGVAFYLFLRSSPPPGGPRIGE